MPPAAPPSALPPGTSVTLRTPQGHHPAGAVGVVARAPGQDSPSVYGVQFPDGALLDVNRVHVGVRRKEAEALPADDTDYFPYVQYRCVMGSRAFGLDTAGSDTDLRGFYLPPATAHWSLGGVPEQLERGEEVYWEARKFVLLALKANPNVLEVLYSPQVLTVTPTAQALLDIRGAFLSRLVYQTYGGYVMSQFGRLEADRRNHGDIRPKHVMHLLRLLLSGIHILTTGEVLVDVGEHRAALLAVKSGELSWEETGRWRLDLHRAFDDAYAQTHLPERPDYARAEAWLIGARQAALEW